jgi:lipoprotein NlpD
MTTSRHATDLPRTPSVLALAAIAILAAGCASKSPAPVVERQAVPRAKPVAPATAVPAATPGAPARATPEPDWRPPTYTVKRGDTLYQIALEHGLDYRDLASWNGIENHNVIRIGQVLRLSAPGSEPPAMAAVPDAGAPGTTVTPLRTVPPVTGGAVRPDVAPLPPGTTAAASQVSPAPPPDGLTKTSPKAIKEPWSAQAMRDVARLSAEPVVAAAKAPPAPSAPPSTSAAATAAGVAPAGVSPPPPPAVAVAPSAPPGPSPGDDEGLDWVWPAKGKLVAQFSESASLKGIDIAGNAGDAVVASAPGKVVYAGNGLRGYGKLVIVKHNATYLTAYAHNADILVKEGQSVARGQKIAEMGSTDADRVKLHFEIRRLGKPMDPLRFLPPA